jgi:UDP-perosamine 4-acetyltransferase
MRKKIVIIGTGGLAREFTDFFYDQIDIIGYSSKDKNEYDEYNLKYYGGKFFNEDITPDTVGTNMAVIAIGILELKHKIYKDLFTKGFMFPSFIHNLSYISRTSYINIYDGIIISPNVIISTDVEIKKMTYINTTCSIGHDVKIGNFCQLNGGQIGGNTIIGNDCFIGSGTTIIEKRIIGNNVFIGSGSTVMTNIQDNVNIMGNPAKVYNFRKPIDD